MEITCPLCGKTLTEKGKEDKPFNPLIPHKVVEIWEKMRAWTCEDCKIVIMQIGGE